MANSSKIENQLRAALKLAAEALNLEDYTVPPLNLEALMGYGFSSQFYKPSLIDTKTNEKIQLAIKKAPDANETRKINAIEDSYKNETYFYTHIYPAMQDIQKEHKVSQLFNCVPQYVTSVDKIGEELIVFKDVTVDGFQLRDKHLLFDDEHTSLIFQTYGRFHAISFCLIKKDSEKFHKLVEPLSAIWKKMIKTYEYKTYIENVLKEAYEALDVEADGPIREKFTEYVSNSAQKFEEALSYHGKYLGLLHGDCWSNNTMFKYKDYQKQKGLEKLILLDFQMVLLGTPIVDLSYFFYSGCDASRFEGLNYYLDLYYDSFTKTCSDLNENSNELFPREALTEDFRQYSKIGVILSLILVKYKLMPKEEAVKLRENMDAGKTTDEDLKMNVDETVYKDRVRDILRHAYKNNAL